MRNHSIIFILLNLIALLISLSLREAIIGKIWEILAFIFGLYGLAYTAAIFTATNMQDKHKQLDKLNIDFVEEIRNKKQDLNLSLIKQIEDYEKTAQDNKEPWRGSEFIKSYISINIHKQSDYEEFKKNKGNEIIAKFISVQDGLLFDIAQRRAIDSLYVNEIIGNFRNRTGYLESTIMALPEKDKFAKIRRCSRMKNRFYYWTSDRIQKDLSEILNLIIFLIFGIITISIFEKWRCSFLPPINLDILIIALSYIIIDIIIGVLILLYKYFIDSIRDMFQRSQFYGVDSGEYIQDKDNIFRG